MGAELPKTIVHALLAQAGRLKDAPALWTRRGETWVPTSWRQYGARVRDFALGLQSLGFQRGESLTITGFNREEWLVACLGAIASGGTSVGIYTTSSAEQVEYITGHCEAPIAVVENETYLRALLSVRAKLPKLKHIIVMEAPATPVEGVLTFAEVLAKGATGDEGDFYARLDALQPDEIAQMIYTSGTTGAPKGVMLSHHNICWTATQLLSCADVKADDVVLSYLPLSHIAEQITSIYGPISAGAQLYFARSFEKLPDDLKEVRPTVFVGVPRVWEKFKAKAEAGIASQPPMRQRLVKWARGVTARFHDEQFAHKQSSLTLQAEYALARKLVFKPLKTRIGLDRARFLITSAAPISREVLEFFASVDMPICEIYGQSEVTGPTSVSTPSAMKLGKLGRPMPGVEVRIDEDGEILVRGGNVCLGYYKNPEATAELLQDGWLHSGDVGRFDEDGFLEITGRKKEIIVTSGGKKTSPANIESLLRNIDPLGPTLVFGERRKFLVALLTVDPDRLARFAKEHDMPASTADLAKHAGFRAYLRDAIEREVNPRVSRFESIKQFEVLPNEFTIDGGELTSTLKLRRKVVEQKYAADIERLYASEG